jgi:hypothetical protein
MQSSDGRQNALAAYRYPYTECNGADTRTGAPSKLASGLCHLLNFELEQSRAQLDAYEPIAAWGPIGVIQGMNAILSGDAPRAVEVAGRYRRLCQQNGEACPGETATCLNEIATLALMLELQDLGGFSTALRAHVATYGFDQHRVVVNYVDGIAAWSGKAEARSRLDAAGLGLSEVRDAGNAAMRREQFATLAGVPLRGEPDALSKPVTLLTDWWMEQP